MFEDLNWRRDIIKIKEISPFFLGASLIFAMSILAGYLIAWLYPDIIEKAIENVSGTLNSFTYLGPLELTLFIFMNNSLATLIAIVGGFLLGVIPILVLIVNGLIIGGIFGNFTLSGLTLEFIAGTFAHGIIEIPIVMYASAIGLLFGYFSWRKLIFKEDYDWKRLSKRGIYTFILVVLPILFIASVVEVFISSKLLLFVM